MSFTLTQIDSFLVDTNKSKKAVTGTAVPLKGTLFDMLNRIFQNSDAECRHDIAFNKSQDGKQQNEVRDLMIDYLGAPSQGTGMPLAKRLQSVTTERSGMGLLFLLTGSNATEERLVVSRFPADSAILADDSGGGLTVQFLEKVFMKSATSYKAAVYRAKSLSSGFWQGRAVDKQVNGDLTISTYWIEEFLNSGFRITPAHGTRRLATYLREAIKAEEDIAIKESLIAAAQLAKGFNGQALTPESFCKQLKLSKEATQALLSRCPNDDVKREQFRFNVEEFGKQLSIRTVQLDNGGSLTAPADDFNRVFRQDQVDGKAGKVQFTTQGVVVDDQLRKDGRQ